MDLMLVDETKRPRINKPAHGNLADSDMCLSMPRTYLNGFGLRSKGHAYKHANGCTDIGLELIHIGVYHHFMRKDDEDKL